MDPLEEKYYQRLKKIADILPDWLWWRFAFLAAKIPEKFWKVAYGMAAQLYTWEGKQEHKEIMDGAWENYQEAKQLTKEIRGHINK